MDSDQRKKILEFFSVEEDSAKDVIALTTFQILAATILSAQCTWRQVATALPKLFAFYPTCETMSGADVEHVLECISSVTFPAAKAKYLVESAKMLITTYSSQIPSTREELLKLPGVGRKTANVILSEAFGQNELAVDTHIFRVSRRLGLSTGKTPTDVEMDLRKLFPAEILRNLHHSIIWFGRRTCRAISPKCKTCQFSEFCPWYLETNETNRLGESI